MPYKSKIQKSEHNKKYREEHRDYFKEYFKHWYTENSDYFRKWNKLNSKKRREYSRKGLVRYRKNSANFYKISARQETQKAIRLGTLVRPDRCSSCNLMGKIQAHHPDYSKPLEIMWMCRNCHELEHHK